MSKLPQNPLGVGFKKIKILHVLPIVGFGGVERRRLLMVQNLDLNKFEHKIACLKINSVELLEEFKKYGVEVVQLKGGYKIFNPLGFLELLRILRVWKPDIVHGAVFEGIVFAGLAGFISKKAKVILEETSDLNNKPRSPAMAAFVRLLSWRAQAYIAVSPPVFKYLVERQKISLTKARLILNGIGKPIANDLESIDSIRAKLHISQEDLVIGAVSRLNDSFKRISDIIRAVSLLKHEHGATNIKLLIVGGGPDHDLLQNLVVEMKIEEMTKFAGPQFFTGNYFKLIDIFVMPSAHEAFGLAVVEAMVMGLPVITTDVGFFKNIVAEGENGFVVPPLRPDKIAEALLKLVKDPKLRASMGKKSQEIAEQKFSAERYAHSIKDLYEELVNG